MSEDGWHPGEPGRDLGPVGCLMAAASATAVILVIVVMVWLARKGAGW
jgi:hypothetical protein